MATADKLQTIIDNNETIKGHVADSLLAVEAKGVTLPDDAKLANLPTLIAGIESGGSDSSILPTIPPMAGTGEHMVRFIDHNGVFLIHKVDDGASIDLDSIAIPQYSGLRFVEFISDRSLSDITYNVDVGVFYELDPDENNGQEYGFDYISPYGGLTPSIYIGKGSTVYWGDGQSSTNSSTKSSATVSPDSTIPSGEYRLATGSCPIDNLSDFDEELYLTNIYGLSAINLSSIGTLGYSLESAAGFTALKSIVGTQSMITIDGDGADISRIFLECINLRAFVGYFTFALGDNILELAGLEDIHDITSYMFAGCSSLTEVVLTGSVGEIKSNAFNGCSSLTQILIPSSVTSIKSTSFDACAALGLIDMVTIAAVPTLDAGWTPANTNLKILVPFSLYDDFLADEAWATMTDYIISA